MDKSKMTYGDKKGTARGANPGGVYSITYPAGRKPAGSVPANPETHPMSKG
jgi:hypothetical protein